MLRGALYTGAHTIADPAVYAKVTIKTRDDASQISISVIGSWKYHPTTTYNNADYNREDAIRDINKLIDSFYDFVSNNSTKW